MATGWIFSGDTVDDSVPIRLAAKASVERGCGETQPQKLLHCRGWCFAHGSAPSELATNRTGMDDSSSSEFLSRGIHPL